MCVRGPASANLRRRPDGQSGNGGRHAGDSDFGAAELQPSGRGPAPLHAWLRLSDVSQRGSGGAEHRPRCAAGRHRCRGVASPGAAHDRAAFPPRCLERVFWAGGQHRYCRRRPLRPRPRSPPRSEPAHRAVLRRLRRRHESGAGGRRCLRLPAVVGVDVAHLVGARHLRPQECRGAPRRPCLPGHGGHRHHGAAVRFRRHGGAGRRLCLRQHARRPLDPSHCRAGAGGGPRGGRLQGGHCPSARMAAACPSRRPQPRLGPDERGDDQGRGLRLHPHRVRPAWRAHLVVEHDRAGAGRRQRSVGRALCPHAARPQAAARLSHGGEHRHHLHRPRPCACLRGQRHAVPGRACADGSALPRLQPFAVQGPACFSARAPCCMRPASATWRRWAALSTTCR